MNKALLYLFTNTGLLNKDVVEDAADRQELLRAVCPIHDNADNPNGFALKTNAWFCNTAKCHDKYGCGLEGLVVALADRYARPAIRARDDRGRPRFSEARRWLKREAGTLRERFADWPTSRTTSRSVGRPSTLSFCSRQRALESLVIPSAYFQNRGFGQDVLRQYAIGEPTLPDGVFARRKDHAIVPLFDLDKPDVCIGYAARSHRDDGPYRWRLSLGLPASHRLFGYERACGPNLKFGRLFLVEGVGDALRLMEAGYPEAVAVLGSTLMPEQVARLARMRLRETIVVADKDDPGEAFAAKVQKEMAPHSAAIRVIYPPDPFKDVGEMPTPAAREFLRQAFPTTN